MTNYSPYPKRDDQVVIHNEDVISPWPNGRGQDRIDFLRASFASGDRPLDLMGFGTTDREAVADLYRALRDAREPS